MPLYEFECPEHGKFEKSYTRYDVSSSPCPVCSKPARLLMSLSTFRMAEPFKVVGSDGRVTQEKQVLNNMPDWRETKPIEYPDAVPKPIISRGGNVYYPRKQRVMV